MVEGLGVCFRFLAGPGETFVPNYHAGASRHWPSCPHPEMMKGRFQACIRLSARQPCPSPGLVPRGTNQSGSLPGEMMIVQWEERQQWSSHLEVFHVAKYTLHLGALYHQVYTERGKYSSLIIQAQRSPVQCLKPLPPTAGFMPRSKPNESQGPVYTRILYLFSLN